MVHSNSNLDRTRGPLPRGIIWIGSTRNTVYSGFGTTISSGAIKWHLCAIKVSVFSCYVKCTVCTFDLYILIIITDHFRIEFTCSRRTCHLLHSWYWICPLFWCSGCNALICQVSFSRPCWSPKQAPWKYGMSCIDILVITYSRYWKVRMCNCMIQ